MRCLPSPPLLLGLFALYRALTDSRALLNDPDTYLHIAVGRWILAHGALPIADPFSHTMAGAAWAVPEWLAEILLGVAYDAGGWAALVMLTAVSLAAAFAILTRYLLRRLDPLPAAVVALAGLVLVLPHLVARPHVLALPILTAWSAAVLAARDAGTRPPWWLLALMPVWANLHGSFLFGLALAAFLAAEAVLQPGDGRSRREQLRGWGMFVVTATAAALLTPNGVAGLVAPFRLMAMPALQATFGEWLPPDLARSPELALWLVGLVVLGVSVRIHLPFFRLVLLAGLLHMALQHVRHADLLGLVGPLVLAGALGSALAERRRPAQPGVGSQVLARFAAPASIPGLVVTLVLAIVLAEPILARPFDRGDGLVTPAAAVTAAGRLALPGPVFNAERFGGYLVFAGIPSFIDGRIEMYGNDFLARAAAAENGDEATLRALLSEYSIGWTLLPPQSGVAAVLDRSPGWRRVYADDYAVVHARLDPATPH